MNKLIIFAGPSGSGKSTIVQHLLQNFPQLAFSISATTRQARENEQHGREYYFLDEEDFKNKIAAQEFIEYEEVYKGTLYGTLHTEIERIAKKNQHVIFDIDVVGALNIKKQFGDRALAIIVMPPSLEILSERLKNRATESKEKVAQRLAKASQELEMAQYFDHQLTNDTLQHSLEQANNLVRNFLHS